MLQWSIWLSRPETTLLDLNRVWLEIEISTLVCSKFTDYKTMNKLSQKEAAISLATTGCEFSLREEDEKIEVMISSKSFRLKDTSA